MGQKIDSFPIILREGAYSKDDLEKLKKQPTWQINDLYDRQSLDLFEIDHPSLIGQSDFQAKAKAFAKERHEKLLSGDWVYYPWSGILIHCATESEQFRLRTNRNKNLVTEDE